MCENVMAGLNLWREGGQYRLIFGHYAQKQESLIDKK